jgi:hypothetical protein
MPQQLASTCMVNTPLHFRYLALDQRAFILRALSDVAKMNLYMRPANWPDVSTNQRFLEPTIQPFLEIDF